MFKVFYQGKPYNTITEEDTKTFRLNYSKQSGTIKLQSWPQTFDFMFEGGPLEIRDDEGTLIFGAYDLILTGHRKENDYCTMTYEKKAPGLIIESQIWWKPILWANVGKK